jgi:hypothetical protein
MNENTDLGAYAIMYVVQNKKNEVVNLLLKNGVVTPSNAQDIQIAFVVTNLLKISDSFYNEFSQLLLDEETVDAVFSNMSGSYLNINGSSDFCKNTANKQSSPTSYKLLCENTSTTTGASITSTKTDKDSGSWLNQGLNLLQTGFQGFLQLDENKTKRQLADASVKISNDEVVKGGATASTKTGLGTGAIVGISLLGVTVVGLVVYLIAKKR